MALITSGMGIMPPFTGQRGRERHRNVQAELLVPGAAELRRHRLRGRCEARALRVHRRSLRLHRAQAFLLRAFLPAARRADPDTLLFYNDYGTETGTANTKAEQVFKLCPHGLSTQMALITSGNAAALSSTPHGLSSARVALITSGDAVRSTRW